MLKILHYDKINVSQEVNIAKSNNSNKCMICHYCFFNNEFKFQDSVCNGCHNTTNLSVNRSNIAIITVKNVHYCCIIYNINKSEANSLFKKLCSSKP